MNDFRVYNHLTEASFFTEFAASTEALAKLDVCLPLGVDSSTCLDLELLWPWPLLTSPGVLDAADLSSLDWLPSDWAEADFALGFGVQSTLLVANPGTLASTETKGVSLLGWDWSARPRGVSLLGCDWLARPRGGDLERGGGWPPQGLGGDPNESWRVDKLEIYTYTLLLNALWYYINNIWQWGWRCI